VTAGPAGTAVAAAAVPVPPTAADAVTDLAAAEDARLAGRRSRYVADLTAMHDRISLRGLVDRCDPLYVARRPDGLTVLAVPQSGLPDRYRLMIYGFRLAQYLRLRFASDEIAYDSALFAEPHDDHGEEVHVMALREETGAILRYVSYVGTTDQQPLPLTHPARRPFPAEVAHGVNFFDHVPVPDSVRSDEVWEVKRLVQRGSEQDASAATRLRVSLEMMLAFYRTLRALDPAPRYLVGDGEEGLAIRRLTRSLRDITVIEGTAPSLPHTDLHFPLYVTRDVVKPFVARAPGGEELDRLIGWLERALTAADPLAGFKNLVATVEGTIRRVRI